MNVADLSRIIAIALEFAARKRSAPLASVIFGEAPWYCSDRA